MSAVIGQEFNRLICAALGIDPSGVRRVELVAACDAVVTVRTERLVRKHAACQLVSLLTQYEVRAVKTALPVGYDPRNHRGSRA